MADQGWRHSGSEFVPLGSGMRSPIAGGRRAVPAHVAQLCPRMYGAVRYLTLDDAATRAGFPSRGVVAGCGLATLHTQAYTIEHLQDLSSEFAGAVSASS